MNKSRLIMLVCALGVLSVPASASEANVWVPLEFSTAAPCTIACPYWMNVLNADVDSDGREDLRFDACGNPDGTDGSLSDVPGLPYEKGVIYDEILVGPRPEGTGLLIVELDPTVDWDLFICTDDGHDAGPCAGTMEECTKVWPGCDNILGPESLVPIGCRERHVIPTASGRQYVLRAYNWSDPFPLEGRYCWSTAGSCA